MCSVRKGSFCIVYCRLGISLLVDFEGCCVGLILGFVFLLASHDFSSLCLGFFDDLLSMNP